MSEMNEKDRAQLERAANEPLVGSRWRHFKGGTYKVLATAVDEETLRLLVIYQSEQTGGVWARPLVVWDGFHPQHNVKRFERLPD